jgi:hypothetical protein
MLPGTARAAGSRSGAPEFGAISSVNGVVWEWPHRWPRFQTRLDIGRPPIGENPWSLRYKAKIRKIDRALLRPATEAASSLAGTFLDPSSIVGCKARNDAVADVGNPLMRSARTDSTD